MKYFAYNAASICFAICGCFIAVSGNDGWGWFLTVAALTAVLPK